MTLRIAQISDLHFGRDVPHIAQALLADLQNAELTVVAVCGDLTQAAREREFMAAKEFLDQLPAPVLVVPGNHDLPGWKLWSRFSRPWRLWRRHIAAADPSTATTLLIEGLVVVGVNTARQWGLHLDWSRGRINTTQIAAIEKAFDRAESHALRVVVTHHPFLLTHAGRLRGLVGRNEMALQRLRNRADLLFGGHVHIGYSGVASGVVVAQSGTAFSDRLKGEPNSYNLIVADGDEVSVTVHGWNGHQFLPVRSDRYVRTRSDTVREWRRVDPS